MKATSSISVYFPRVGNASDFQRWREIHEWLRVRGLVRAWSSVQCDTWLVKAVMDGRAGFGVVSNEKGEQ